MKKKYINTNRDKASATYTRVEPTFDGTILTFTVKSASPFLGGKAVPMTHARLRMVTPAEVSNCDPNACKPSVDQSVTLDFNVLQGTDPSAMFEEARRVLELAIEDFKLSFGVVPPATAEFNEA